MDFMLQRLSSIGHLADLMPHRALVGTTRIGLLNLGDLECHFIGAEATYQTKIFTVSRYLGDLRVKPDSRAGPKILFFLRGFQGWRSCDEIL